MFFFTEYLCIKYSVSFAAVAPGFFQIVFLNVIYSDNVQEI